MKGKRLLGIALAISSLSLLLVAAATAGPTAKRGGTIVLDMTTDVDYIDPQLSYYGETWKLEATTACKLMNWPDKEGPAGAVATPEVASATSRRDRLEIASDIPSRRFNFMWLLSEVGRARVTVTPVGRTRHAGRRRAG